MRAVTCSTGVLGKLMLFGVALALSTSCNKKKGGGDDAADLTGATTQIVVSGDNPVTGDNIKTVIKTTPKGTSVVTTVSSETDGVVAPDAVNAIKSDVVTSDSISIKWDAATG